MALPDQIKEVKKIALALGAILLVGLGIILSLLIPQITDSRRQAEEGFALTNVKKVAAALLAYASEHGVLPNEETYAYGPFAPGLMLTDFQVHPNGSEILALNSALAGRPLPKGSAKEILIFPGPKKEPLGILDPSDVVGDKPCVAWTDGEAECLASEELFKLMN